MQQFLINLTDLQNLINNATDANRVLITVDLPNGNGNGKTKSGPAIKLRAVKFLDGGLVDSTNTTAGTPLAPTTMALSLDARAAEREVTGCPYPPGC